MRKFSPLAMLRQFGIQAAIPVAIILGGHWVRDHALELEDFITAAGVFIVYLFLASWLESRKTPKL